MALLRGAQDERPLPVETRPQPLLQPEATVNRFLLAVLVGSNCWAQMTAPKPPYYDWRILIPVPYERSPLETPSGEMPTDKPTAQSVSVRQLQHKIPKEVARAYHHALKLSRRGEHLKATAELESIVQREPEFFQAANLLGVEYAHLRRSQEAEAAFRRSLELEPSSWSANYNLAITLFGRGDLAGARESTRRALLYSSQNPRVHLLLGELLVVQEETREEGLTELKIAARSMPDARRLLRNLGVR